jgi:hypothetical protein
MEIRGKQEYMEMGETHIESIVDEIVKEMPDFTKEECATLNAKGSVIRVIPTKGIPVALYGKISSSVREIIGEKTFDTREIDVSDQPIYEEQAKDGIILSIFYKRNTLIVS